MISVTFKLEYNQKLKKKNVQSKFVTLHHWKEWLENCIYLLWSS